MINGHLEMISKIKNAMDLVSDLKGWKRSVAIAEVIRMLEALSDGIKKSEEAHKAEKELLLAQIENIKKKSDSEETDSDVIETVGGEHIEYKFGGEEK